MTSLLNPPLQACNGQTLEALAICRISTAKQDERSLGDQEALYREYLERHTDLPFRLTVIAGQGSGEALDRKEYLDAVQSVESNRFDLVITEDLGRICRRVYAHIFCELCEDHQTRLIAINDHVDTAREDWRLGSFFAVMRHETYNKDTGQRIRRSQRNRFQNSGMFQSSIYGYVKTPGCTSDADVQKDPNAGPVLDRWFSMLEDGASYAEVADWLNEKNVKPGPYCRLGKWDRHMVARVTFNPILKGVRLRNRKVSRRINQTGRRRSVNAPPEELLERHCPHLAFIETERYDRVIDLLNARNGKYRRRKVDGRDPRANVPKKRSRWPGQHIYCGVCGRMFTYGGHGQASHLFCNGARQYECWNSITVDAPLAAQKLSSAVFERIAVLPDWDAEFAAMAREEAEKLQSQSQGRLQEMERDFERLEREIANVLKAVRETGGIPSLFDELRRLETEKDELTRERDRAVRMAPKSAEIPAVAELQAMARNAFRDLAIESPEFARHMKRLIPKIFVFPYRLVDGGHIVLRARFTLDLSSFAPGVLTPAERPSPLRTELIVDLFNPPQREEFRERVCALRSQGATERDVARSCGITITAAQDAARLARIMDEQELTDPYIPVKAPPVDYTKLRRYKSKRYRFEPLAGFPADWPT